MEKKLTKTQLKELNESREQFRRLRNQTITDFNEYVKDVDSTTRYYLLHDMKDKLDYRGHLTVEEKLELMRNYHTLDFLKPYGAYTEDEKKNGDDRASEFMRIMIISKEEFKKLDGDLVTTCKADISYALWFDEIIWNTKQVELYLKLAKKFGYESIYYTNSSTGALANITDFIKFGAKVIATCSRKSYNQGGLVFDITEVNLENEENL